MYDESDPRAAQTTSSGVDTGTATVRDEGVPSAEAASQYLRLHELPARRDGGAPTWWLRSQNMLLSYSEVETKARFTPVDQDEEWMLLLPSGGTSAHLVHGKESVQIQGRQLILIPPGPTEVTVSGVGPVLRLFTTRDLALVSLASNADQYVMPRSGVRPLDAVPRSLGDDRIRSYALDVPPQEGRFGRIWRSSSLMVNYLEPWCGPRDPATLSPHSHEDFEQITFALTGEHMHHIRWQWGRNRTTWRDDEHTWVPSPSAAIIPPATVHTSEGVGHGLNQLIDFFGPVRADFLAQGWVLNADEYEARSDEHGE